jgi:peptidoglycan/xylan/chitin deacetylase (PgdA/CDA1 family)
MAPEQGTSNTSCAEGSPRRIKVLMYHRVTDDKEARCKHWACVHVREFRRQLASLERLGFTAITFEDYRLYLAGELNLPRKPVILTFDGGYMDTYENAFLLLQEYGMKAVVFTIGNRHIRTNVWCQALGMPTGLLMESQQLIEMHAAGFEIGAHPMNYTRLTTLSDEEAWEEISRSRMLLEILLNSSVRSFAYPYGHVSRAIKRMVKDAGYSHACSTLTGPAAFCADPYEIRRIAIEGTTGLVGFEMRMLTPFQNYEWLRWKMSRTHSGLDGKHIGDGESNLEDKEKSTALLTRSALTKQD